MKIIFSHFSGHNHCVYRGNLISFLKRVLVFSARRRQHSSVMNVNVRSFESSRKKNNKREKMKTWNIASQHGDRVDNSLSIKMNFLLTFLSFHYLYALVSALHLLCALFSLPLSLNGNSKKKKKNFFFKIYFFFYSMISHDMLWVGCIQFLKRAAMLNVKIWNFSLVSSSLEASSWNSIKLQFSSFLCICWTSSLLFAISWICIFLAWWAEKEEERRKLHFRELNLIRQEQRNHQVMCVKRCTQLHCLNVKKENCWILTKIKNSSHRQLFGWLVIAN